MNHIFLRNARIKTKHTDSSYKVFRFFFFPVRSLLTIHLIQASLKKHFNLFTLFRTRQDTSQRVVRLLYLLHIPRFFRHCQRLLHPDRQRVRIIKAFRVIRDAASPVERRFLILRLPLQLCLIMQHRPAVSMCMKAGCHLPVNRKRTIRQRITYHHFHTQSARTDKGQQRLIIHYHLIAQSSGFRYICQTVKFQQDQTVITFPYLLLITGSKEYDRHLLRISRTTSRRTIGNHFAHILHRFCLRRILHKFYDGIQFHRFT